jgi:hypothetical protein
MLQVYVILLLIFSGLLLGFGPQAADEGRKLAAALPGLLDQMSEIDIISRIAGKHPSGCPSSNLAWPRRSSKISSRDCRS